MKVFKTILQIIGTIAVIAGLIPTYHAIKMCFDPSINFGVGSSPFEIAISIILIIFLYVVTAAAILAFLTFAYNIIDVIREENAKERKLEKKVKK